MKLVKPYQESPMFPHASGQWAKKIKGKVWYFGTWEDHGGALKKYNDWIDEIHAGRVPRRSGAAQVNSGTLSVADLCNLFLERQQSRVETSTVSNGKPNAVGNLTSVQGRSRTQPLDIGVCLKKSIVASESIGHLWLAIMVTTPTGITTFQGGSPGSGILTHYLAGTDKCEVATRLYKGRATVVVKRKPLRAGCE